MCLVICLLVSLSCWLLGFLCLVVCGWVGNVWFGCLVCLLVFVGLYLGIR